ncbi:uncharacterized protein I303_102393 [Kwoniella dejecticola CBS 10117]|uniref:NF-X1-type domain-containing protein n=1 Tax=Kwoniella dejecticola CBS 10117 TaxID=1296121 RepID=A0A1A6AB15_9TREE|nr:uncharacterized protein I303_01468 [Kwoniella dejecticola CBS 10117]OBR87266.1 hypothetical protein I303_01468 [Kwoniella dejecticola CBS 10117]
MAEASTSTLPASLLLSQDQTKPPRVRKPRSKAPRPQPGDGAYLAAQHHDSNNIDQINGHRGRANGHRQNGHRPNDLSSGLRPAGNGLDRGNVQGHPHSSNNHLHNHPSSLTREDRITRRDGTLNRTNRSNSSRSFQSRTHDSSKRPPNSLPKKPAPIKQPKQPQLQQAGSGLLDAEAPPFTPGTALPTSDVTDNPHGEITNPSSASERSGVAKKQNQRIRKPKPPRSQANPDQSPQPAVTSRKAAFQQSNKLTKTISRSSAENSVSKSAQAQAKKPQVERRKKDEPDDLVSRLTRGLRQRPFLECPICFNAITPSQQTWSCLPPDHAPEPSSSITLQPNPITGSTSTSNYYSACYTPFHLECIKDWASLNLEDEEKKARVAGGDGEDIAWRCPGCQKRRADRPAGYRCFCGRLSHPPTSTSAPHSCNDGCARKRPKCDHPCPLPCHPGPCPPCQVALVVPCPSHHTSLTVKCSAATTNNAALSPVCDEPCSRHLDCGNKDHECQQLCHFGPCKPCEEREIARCYCGQDEREVECGWGKESDKVCKRLDEDGEEEVWWGKYDCGRDCERLFDCGVHPCKETCHPHPIHPLHCPLSTDVITHCACGTTLLSTISAVRENCLSPIPTCNAQCPKSRPCGHVCPKKCHTGPCPPCHEEVIKTCRCGQSQLLVPCDELREKAERGEDEVTCERVCRSLRSCGRHECGRLCCPLWEQAFRSKRQRNEDLQQNIEDDLHKCHLTCGRMLSCGIHTCPKPDHKGQCGRCLQASYDELICHCENTVVYPPVACGTTINCPYPCDRPAPECGHPKSPHSCHESPECPPCPYLTDKPCACGKDPSVKHVRCSQDRVSCGQQCGELLGCGYHKCTKLCHRPGECESCTQVCSKPKKICKHPCTSTCHAPARCSENDPCQAIVTQSCACGHLQSRTSCGASVTNPKSREVEQLKCNSECAVRQRNARLAEALGIKPSEKGLEVYEDEIKNFASQNHGFVKMVEGTFEEFIKGARQSMVLPHMPPAKRVFVMSLADHYRLNKELVDQEPNRSVQIRRRVDTRVPSPTLSSSVNPTSIAAPQTRLVTNLGGAWGKSGGSTAASVVAGHAGATSSGAATWVSTSGSSSNRPSRVPTPVAPILRETSQPASPRRPQGGANDGEDDWDVDV